MNNDGHGLRVLLTIVEPTISTDESWWEKKHQLCVAPSENPHITMTIGNPTSPYPNRSLSTNTKDPEYVVAHLSETVVFFVLDDIDKYQFLYLCTK